MDCTDGGNQIDFANALIPSPRAGRDFSFSHRQPIPWIGRNGQAGTSRFDSHRYVPQRDLQFVRCLRPRCAIHAALLATCRVVAAFEPPRPALSDRPSSWGRPGHCFPSPFTKARKASVGIRFARPIPRSVGNCPVSIRSRTVLSPTDSACAASFTVSAIRKLGSVNRVFSIAFAAWQSQPSKYTPSFLMLWRYRSMQSPPVRVWIYARRPVRFLAFRSAACFARAR
jgi:hypothetical protein